MRRSWIILLLVLNTVWAYGQQFVQPEYRGGDFTQYLVENLTFPERALADGMTGVAEASFDITWSGDMENLVITREPHPAIGDELFRAVWTSRGNWRGGRADGVPETLNMSLVVDFSNLLEPETLEGLTIVEQYVAPLPISPDYPGLTLDELEMLVRFEYAVPEGLAGLRSDMDISIAIGADGNVAVINIENCPDERLRAELERILRDKVTAWTPAMVNFRSVDFTHRFKFRCVIDGDGSKDNSVAYMARTMIPYFLTGKFEDYERFVNSVVIYPESIRNKQERTILVRFCVNVDGNVGEIQMMSEGTQAERLMFAEVVRVMGLLPKWTPASVMGVPEKRYFTMVVNFVPAS